MSRGPRKSGDRPTKPPTDDVATRPGELQEIQFQALTWRAPIPPPEIVKAYDELIEGGAERLFRQFEIEANERRTLVRRNQSQQFFVQIIARLSALAFALSALYVANQALERGLQAAAAIIGGGTIALVVAAFTGIPSLLRSRGGDDAK